MVEWILRRMKKKKMKREIFLKDVWLRGGEKKMMVGPPKRILSKMERKLGGGKSYR